jgi:hypothetical protein
VFWPVLLGFVRIATHPAILPRPLPLAVALDNVDALLRLLPRLTDAAIVADPSRTGGRDFLAAARRLFTIDTQRDPVRERVVVHRLRRGRGRGR